MYRDVRKGPRKVARSHLLSNILLDDLDKELERRGHTFCRYADDCNIYVRTKRAGERVLASVTQYLARKLKLRVNPDKSAVDRPWNRKFLGYGMTFHRQPGLKATPAAKERFKSKLRVSAIPTRARAQPRAFYRVSDPGAGAGG